MLLFVGGYRAGGDGYIGNGLTNVAPPLLNWMTSDKYYAKDTLFDLNKEEFLEYPQTDNTITAQDRFVYWRTTDGQKDIAKMFQDKLKPEYTFYADGHHSVKTSNHRSAGNYLTSQFNLQSDLTKEKYIIEFEEKERDGRYYLVTHKKDNPCYGRTDLNACYNINTERNDNGFKERFENGKTAGSNFLNEIKKDYPNSYMDLTIDIVAHSMGYAYSMGIIEVLKNNGYKKLGGYYIIAPENAGSPIAKVDTTIFKEVIQFGSNEKNTPLKDQDGVAPQTTVNGLDDKKNRQYYPHGNSKYPENFIKSHSILNYEWIFELDYIHPR